MGFWRDYSEACATSTTVDNIRQRRMAAERERQHRLDLLREREVRAMERAAGIPDGYDP